MSTARPSSYDGAVSAGFVSVFLSIAMNFEDWIIRLKGTLSRFRKSKYVSIIAEDIHAPLGEAGPLPAREFVARVCPDLLAFYSAASAQCRVRFNIERAERVGRSRVKTEVSFPNPLAGGFCLAPLSALKSLHEEMSEQCLYLAGSRPGRGAAKRAMKEVLKNSLPFSRTAGGDYVVVVGDNNALTPGVYFFPVGVMGCPDGQIPYSRSIVEWLKFLEASFYIGPEWNHVCFWFREGHLHVNEQLSSDVQQCIQAGRISPRDIPRESSKCLSSFDAGEPPASILEVASRTPTARHRHCLRITMLKRWQERVIELWFESPAKREEAKAPVAAWMDKEKARLGATMVLVTSPT